MTRKTHVSVHVPRKTEADCDPPMSKDLKISPKFYRRSGWVPVFYFTVVDAQNNESRYVMTMSAATRQMRIEKLVEVVPVCDDPDSAYQSGKDKRSAANDSKVDAISSTEIEDL